MQHRLVSNKFIVKNNFIQYKFPILKPNINNNILVSNRLFSSYNNYNQNNKNNGKNEYKHTTADKIFIAIVKALGFTALFFMFVLLIPLCFIICIDYPEYVFVALFMAFVYLLY